MFGQGKVHWRGHHVTDGARSGIITIANKVANHPGTTSSTN